MAACRLRAIKYNRRSDDQEQMEQLQGSPDKERASSPPPESCVLGANAMSVLSGMHPGAVLTDRYLETGVNIDEGKGSVLCFKVIISSGPLE